MKKQILLLIALLIGCTGHPGQSPTTPPDTQVLGVELSDPHVHTRASEDGEGHEDLIEQIMVTFVGTDGSSWTPINGQDYTWEGGRIIFKKERMQLQEKEYTAFVFANYPQTTQLEGKSREELQALLPTTLDLHSTNGKNTPSTLPMIGEVTFTYQETAQEIAKVSLQRQVAKLRVTVFFVGTNIRSRLSLEEHPPRVRIVDYKTNFVSSELHDTEPLPLNQERHTEDGLGYTHEFPIYAPPYSWSAQTSRPKFIISLPLKDNVGRIREYYYTGSFVDPGNPSGQYFAANTLYDLLINIDELGSTELQDPAILTGKTVLKPWNNSDYNVDVDVRNNPFLHVTPKKVDIYSDHLLIRYSSTSPLLKTGTKVSGYYTTYVLSNDGQRRIGDPIRNDFELNAEEVITYDGANTTGFLTFKYDRPDNNTPRHITITLQNSSGQERTIEVTQYPDIVVTTELALHKETDNTNSPLLYIFRTASAGSVTINGKTYRVGYPSPTNPSEEDNELISPCFMIAAESNRRRTTMSKSNAESYIRGYFEQTTDNRTYTGWRLPTRAELELIRHISTKPNSITGGNILDSQTAPPANNHFTIYDPRATGLRHALPIRDITTPDQ